MRKSTCILIALTLVSLLGIILVYNDIHGDRNRIIITETPIIGDVSATEGITVISNMNYDDQLLWKTTHRMGENSSTETEFTFHQTDIQVTYQNEIYSFYLNDGIRYGGDFKTPAEEQTGLSKVYKELYDESVRTGKTASRIVDLKDIYEYYPLEISMRLPGVTWERTAGDVYDTLEYKEKDLLQTFRDFFKIPLPENQLMEVSVSVGANHLSTGSGNVKDSDQFYFQNCFTYTGTKLFFSFSNETLHGNKINTDGIKGGYGIYSFQYRWGEGLKYADLELVASTLKTAVRLDESEVVQAMCISKDGQYLEAFIEKDGNTYLRVYDVNTLEKVTEVVIEDFNFITYDRGEDYIVLNGENKIALIETEEENYTLKITAPSLEIYNEKMSFMKTNSIKNYDGNRLVIVDNLPYSKEGFYHQYDKCGFYMAIYDETGLIYYGEYENSIDSDYAVNGRTDTAIPSVSEPYVILFDN